MNNNEDLIAKASTVVDAPIAQVWDALVNPDAIKQYMFGTNVATDWREGSRITWSGEWQGRQYEDKGVLLKVEPQRTLQYTHYSPLTGAPDVPESYHTVTVTLAEDQDGTRVSLEQGNNPSAEARAHSEKNWTMMLGGLKKYVEQQAGMRQ